VKETAPPMLVTVAIILAGWLRVSAVAQADLPTSTEAAKLVAPVPPRPEVSSKAHLAASPGRENQSPNQIRPTTAVKASDLSSKRDPFQPSNLKPKRVLDESRPELERYEISELRLTAIFAGIDGKRSASLENSSGRGFLIKRGTIVGASQGTVTDIQPDRIVITELTRDSVGTAVPKTIEILLHTKTKP
jgi:Tfp pilus assembly protein PilP